ncbi:MAG: hypothetical protein IPN17_37895 [Deltaproteobacteria bacterium]|nr:hypothetical protein [Deltaproteobacteria bacterium]
MSPKGSRWCCAKPRCASAESVLTPTMSAPASLYALNASRNEHASRVHPGVSSRG